MLPAISVQLTGIQYQQHKKRRAGNNLAEMNSRKKYGHDTIIVIFACIKEAAIYNCMMMS